MNASPSSLRDGQEAHVVQLYTDSTSLVDMLGRFIGGAVASGDSAIVIATRGHHDALAQGLRARGLDPARAVSEKRFVPVDAHDVLRRVIDNGIVDEGRFLEFMGGLLTHARRAADGRDSRIAVFGELVAILWADGRQEEALQIERLWNQLAKRHYFSLLCAYPLDTFSNDRQVEPFLRMCAQHSGVVPSESDVGAGSAEERLRTIADLQQKTQALEGALKLQQSEERFRLFVDAVRDYAIFMLDSEGYIVSWNTGAQRLKGYLGAEIIGKHFSCFYPELDLRNGKPQWELEVAAKEGRFEDEGWRIRKDGSRFWANVIITAVRDDTGKLVGFGKVTRDITEKMLAQNALQQEVEDRRNAEKRLQDSEESLRRLSLHLLRSQDEERRRIGRELHDSLGQSLAAIKITLDSLNSLLGTHAGRANQMLADCSQLVENSLKEIRTISYLLYPPMLDEMGLKSAVSWYLEGFSARSGIQTTLQADENFGRLRPDAELALFRILQESLTNIHRHAESTKADVRLKVQESGITLEIQDYGKGIRPEFTENSSADWTGIRGVGLRGMTERLQQLGGKLEIISTGTGTTVRALLPPADSSRELAKST